MVAPQTKGRSGLQYV